jgi:hypothetical protein
MALFGGECKAALAETMKNMLSQGFIDSRT